MAEIVVLNGGRLIIEDDINLTDDIMQYEEATRLKAKAEDKGLIFRVCHDRLSDTTSFIVGKEIQAARTVHQDQTICCVLSDAPDPAFKDILEELDAFLNNEGFSVIGEQHGVVIHHFG